MDYWLLLLGFAALVVGGDLLVKGAVGLALKLGMSVLTVGMTVVSFGTSVPELIVSIKAVFQEGDNNLMCVGNVLGSNIANLTLVLGVTAIIAPVVVSKVSLYRDWPVLMLSSLLASYFMLDLQVSKVEGLVLFSLVVLFTGYLVMTAGKSKTAVNPEVDPREQKSTGYNLLFIVLGITGLAFGSDWLVSAATSIASSYKVSPFVIGVTVLAFGTSVPELVTSAIAAKKGQTDLALGNLMGSNIFNILSVLGLTASLKQGPLNQSVLTGDLLWMLAIPLVLLVLMLMKRKLNALKGVLLLLCYAAYVTVLFMR